MFTRIGWAVTWLFAPLAGLAILGVAIFTTLTGYDELAPAALMAVCALVMWAMLIWSVARQLSGRRLQIYLGGCAAFAVTALAISCVPLLSGAEPSSEQVSVDLIQPPKAP